jgi:hypothetical protein
MHLQDLTPLREAHLHERPIREDAGVVHHRIEVAEPIDGPRDSSADAPLVAHVQIECPRLSAEISHLLERTIEVITVAEISEHHPATVPRDLPRVLTSQTTSRTRDQDDTTIEWPHRAPLPRLTNSS